MNHKAEVAIGFGVNMKNYFVDNCLSLHQPPQTHIIHVQRTWVVHVQNHPLWRGVKGGPFLPSPSPFSPFSLRPFSLLLFSLLPPPFSILPPPFSLLSLPFLPSPSPFILSPAPLSPALPPPVPPSIVSPHFQHYQNCKHVNPSQCFREMKV